MEQKLLKDKRWLNSPGWNRDQKDFHLTKKKENLPHKNGQEVKLPIAYQDGKNRKLKLCKL